MVLLKTLRLELRALLTSDLQTACELGADPRVMNSLGGVCSKAASAAWLDRQLAHWQDHGYGRYWVGASGHFVGFVGLSRTDFDRGIVPGVEVAWRLAFAEWGHGYATEAARAVLDHGLSKLELGEIIAVTSAGNARSRRVMDRLGMVYSPHETFDHPLLGAEDPLLLHVVYRLKH